MELQPPQTTRKQQRIMRRKKWLPHEDRLLTEAVALLGRDWSKIAQHVPGRSSTINTQKKSTLAVFFLRFGVACWFCSSFFGLLKNFLLLMFLMCCFISF